LFFHFLLSFFCFQKKFFTIDISVLLILAQGNLFYVKFLINGCFPETSDQKFYKVNGIDSWREEIIYVSFKGIGISEKEK